MTQTGIQDTLVYLWEFKNDCVVVTLMGSGMCVCVWSMFEMQLVAIY